LADEATRARHVLIVNDTEEIIELLREIIEGMGHRVSATTWAPEDLAVVESFNPDLVILDVMMGGEDGGWQLLQKMKLSRKLEKVPIIVCSAALKEVREQEGWLTSKGIKILLKPFELAELERAVERALELPDVIA
jgi:CheY-like chemotaxis protein